MQAEVDKTLDGLGAPRPATVTVRALSGSVVEELVSAGREADLLVVGSRGAGGFSRLMMGSVSSLVAQHAACPVVVIPPEGREYAPGFTDPLVLGKHVHLAEQKGPTAPVGLTCCSQTGGR